MYLALIILVLTIRINRKNQYLMKHIGSTDIPVCLFKNAHTHKIMKDLASSGRSSKGVFWA